MVQVVDDGSAPSLSFLVYGHPLMDGRQVGVAVHVRAAAAARQKAWPDGDEAGQVLVFGAEAVADPCADGRMRAPGGAGLQQQGGRGMRRVVADHAVEQTDLIDVLAEVGQELGPPHARLRALANLPNWGE